MIDMIVGGDSVPDFLDIRRFARILPIVPGQPRSTNKRDVLALTIQ